MSEKIIEFDFDKRTDETYHLMKLLEQRIGDQLYDPEPIYDGVLNNSDRQKLVVLQYELNQVLDGYARSLVKEPCYPGSDPQV